MAEFTFKLPDIGEGIATAEIVAWHVVVGQRVEEDAPLVDMMTDKATVEMECPVSGTVVRLAGAPGDAVKIGAALAVIAVEDGAVALAPPSAMPSEATIEAETPGMTENLPESGRGTGAAPKPSPLQGRGLGEGAMAGGNTGSVSTPISSSQEKESKPAPAASPAVRARAQDLGVDLAQVAHSGGHVRHADLDAFLRYNSAQGYRAPGAGSARADEPIPVIGMRRKIAENMAASKRSIPHFTYVEEIEVTALEAIRGQLNSGGTGGNGARPKLTLLPFLITAICRAIPDFPMLNARYDDAPDGGGAGVVTRYGAVHMGIATQTPAGLMVPVLRDAQGMNIWQLAAGIARLAEAARTGTARREELSGSTITITSLGPLGGIATAPVINRPEVAIIGPNRIIERPVFEAGTDRIRRAKLMNLSIACDHRVVDGWDAANFVQAVKRLIEAPGLLLA